MTDFPGVFGDRLVAREQVDQMRMEQLRDQIAAVLEVRLPRSLRVAAVAAGVLYAAMAVVFPLLALRRRDELPPMAHVIVIAGPIGLMEAVTEAGKKGVAINRYKGLGEMNPEQLWATTMKPEERTLLQVRAEDHAEADQMFTTLMGDQVEPRRKFIEDNALDVKNLDV